jgi:glycosyltransferase involved in cell wall biosynthesis
MSNGSEVTSVTPKKIRTLIPLINSNQWTGGTVFSNNLLYALMNYAPQLEIINVPSSKSEKTSRKYNFEISQKVIKLFSSIYSQKVNGYIQRLKRNLKNDNNFTDVVFALVHCEPKENTATLSWIPDFQHIHLPEMFSPEEIMLRDKVYKETAAKTTLAVLSSQNANQDFAKFTPEYAHKGRVMSFVAQVPDKIYSNPPAASLKKYSLPDKFIYLPNQFWKHKNHILVLKALHILRNANLFPNVICSGNETDYRDPNYFESLKRMVLRFNLQNQIIFLGLIPHEDVFQLIRQSAFVLNPSLFEGWSTTVEETKSVGKRMILSNIEVHKEQNPPLSLYFDPHDPEDLAKAIKNAWHENPPGPDAELELAARRNLPERMKKFANTFVSIANEGVEHARGSYR